MHHNIRVAVPIKKYETINHLLSDITSETEERLKWCS